MSDFWRELYLSFDGLLPGCKGNKCPVACCDRADVLVFPDEKKFLVSVYGEKILHFLKQAQDGYFFLHHCHKNGECLFFEWRPVVCRTYPVVGVPENEALILTRDTDYCPACPDKDSKYYKYCTAIWKRIAKKLNLNLIINSENE